MSELLPWLVGLFVVLIVAGTLWTTFRRTSEEPTQDSYLHALELWIDGEIDEAALMLRQVVEANPESIEPYLQLGNVLRLQGDARRAAVLHRGLTARPGLSRAQKITVGLALAEDLIDLERWEEAGQVLDTLIRDATPRARYWKARFAQRHGQGNLPEAARTLKFAPRHVPEKDAPWFRTAYAGYQLDRALSHAMNGEESEARRRLKDVEKLPGTGPRVTLIRALLAAYAQDAAEALTVAAKGLLDSPRELAIFLPVLENVLLKTGQYARTIPILERACQSENAPPSLWIDLALLYEKLGEREKAFYLLESKRNHPAFTPDSAAPYLRILAAEQPDADFSRVWALLSKPTASQGWICCRCEQTAERVRWFCPSCKNFDSYRPAGGGSEVG